MILKKIISKLIFFIQILKLARINGIKYAYNYLHFRMYYGTNKKFFLNQIYKNIPYPSYLEIEITTRCNLKCAICERTFWKEPSVDMPFEKFMHIINQFPQLKWIGLTGIGESFMHKDYIKILTILKQRNIYIELYDNFHFVDKEKAEKLVELKIDKMFVSMDAATSEAYKKIRCSDEFGKVVNNVKQLFAVKKIKKSIFPEFVFHFIINKHNVNEIADFVNLVHSIAGSGAVIQFTVLMHSFPEIAGIVINEDISDQKNEALNRAKKLGIKIYFNQNASCKKPTVNNCSAWLMPFIFVTGEVIPCCAANEANRRDFQKKYSMGNIFETDFKSIWYGEKYSEFRENLSKCIIPIQCGDCPIFDVEKDNYEYTSN